MLSISHTPNMNATYKTTDLRTPCPAVRHAHSHTLRINPSCSPQRAWTVLLVGARSIQMSVHMSSLCSCKQAVMVYPQPAAAAHESYTGLPADSWWIMFIWLCNKKPWKLLFQTADHKCVGFILTFVEIWWQGCWFTTGFFPNIDTQSSHCCLEGCPDTLLVF